MRSVFWNFWSAFVGWPMIKMAPQYVLYYPVLIGVPLYSGIVLQSAFEPYFDEYDGDVEELKWR